MLGINWNEFNIEQFRRGMAVEFEHGASRDLRTNVTDDNLALTGKIALAHLIEFPDYYTRLEKMEAEAKNIGKASLTRLTASTSIHQRRFTL